MCVCIIVVGLYSEDIRGSVMTLTGLYNGVTHMVFSQDGQSLYTGFRKVEIYTARDGILRSYLVVSGGEDQGFIGNGGKSHP